LESLTDNDIWNLLYYQAEYNDIRGCAIWEEKKEAIQETLPDLYKAVNDLTAAQRILKHVCAGIEHEVEKRAEENGK